RHRSQGWPVGVLLDQSGGVPDARPRSCGLEAVTAERARGARLPVTPFFCLHISSVVDEPRGTAMSELTRRRIAVIGAGPIGLAAAAHLVTKGQTPVVLEAGESVGAQVLAWGHVQVFSPWRYNVDPVAATMLRASGWKEPDPDTLPTGAEIVAEYLRPLAALPQIAPHVRLRTRVVAVARAGHDKMTTTGRQAAPFEL